MTASSKSVRAFMTKIAHLITQRGQPYGSTRLCCEMCGEYGLLKTEDHDWTDDPKVYDNLPEGYIQCRSEEGRVRTEVAREEARAVILAARLAAQTAKL